MTADVAEVVRQGGWLLGLIGAASIAAWSVLAYQWFVLGACRGQWRDAKRAVERLERREATDVATLSLPQANVIGAVLAVCTAEADRRAAGDDRRRSFEARSAPLLRGEALLRRRSLRTVAVLAAAMPLLGLLGTVLGMMQTFSAFTDRGAPDVHMLADGVSRALVTTQAGLVATVPVLLAHGLLSARVGRYLSGVELLVKRIESIVCVGDRTEPRNTGAEPTAFRVSRLEPQT